MMNKNTARPRIAIDGRFILRPLRGMPFYTLMICKNLPKVMPEHDFFIFINRDDIANDAEDNFLPRLSAVEQNPNVKIHDLRSDGEFIWEQVKLPRKLRELKIDLLHMPGNRVCFFAPCIQVATIHDTIEWTRLNLFKGKWIRNGLSDKFYALRFKLYIWAVYRLGLKLLDHILTISNYAKRTINSEFPETLSKTSFVYHGIPPSYSNHRDLSTEPSEKNGVLMLGGDSYQKNPESMIKAWSLLPASLKRKHPLTIAGFKGSKKSSLGAALNKYCGDDPVQVHGWVSDDDLVRLFTKNRVFFFASREEGFGFPLLQAMSIGTPVVTSKADVLVELGQDSVYSADAEDSAALAERLSVLLTNDEAWRSCRARGVELAKSFSWEDNAKYISQLYQQLLRKK